jgi:dipeptidase E
MVRLLLPLLILSIAANADDVPGPARGKLYLTSAAINVLDELIPLLPAQEKGTTDCYVVTAGNLDDNPHWIADEVNAIDEAGRTVRRIDLAVLAKDTLAGAFAGCAVIWVGGGNTFYLLQEVRRSGFDEFVTMKIMAGTTYVGTSAGSIILAPDIGAVRFADDPAQAPDLTSFDGLGLFPMVAFAHFDNPDFKDVYRQILLYALENDVDFVTLKEKQFIIVDGDYWKIVGTR